MTIIIIIMIYYCIESLSIVTIYVIITYHYIVSIVSHMQYDVMYIITANPGLLLPARNDGGGSVKERLPLFGRGWGRRWWLGVLLLYYYIFLVLL